MAGLRVFDLTRNAAAVVLSLTLLVPPLFATPSASLGTIVFADRAHVGSAQASVGGTVFDGDRLSTEPSGSIQVRTGAARFLLSSASSATLSGGSDVRRSATLTAGSATFSTASENAFALHVATALIRPTSSRPTIGSVVVISPKEIVVKCTRGSLAIAVEDDVREIPEGAAYRVVLDSNGGPQGAQGAGTKGNSAPPIKAAKSKFIWYAIAATAAVTGYVISEALESPERP